MTRWRAGVCATVVLVEEGEIFRRGGNVEGAKFGKHLCGKLISFGGAF